MGSTSGRSVGAGRASGALLFSTAPPLSTTLATALLLGLLRDKCLESADSEGATAEQTQQCNDMVHIVAQLIEFITTTYDSVAFMHSGYIAVERSGCEVDH